MCFLFLISCFLPFAFNSFAIDNCISCFFRSSLTFISGDIKQKTGEEVKRQDVKNSKKQETGNKKHIEQTLKSSECI